MVCRYCGSRIPDHSMICPMCGRQVVDSMNHGYAGAPNNRGHRNDGANNIFSPLGNHPGTDDILEFSLWVAMCVAALLALLALILTNNTWGSADEIRIYWLFLMLTEAGTAVAMAFRQRSVAMLCHCFGFVLVLEMGYILYSFDLSDYGGFGLLGVLIFLTAIGYCICACLQYLSRLELKLAVSILNIVLASMAVITFLITIFSTQSSLRYSYLSYVKYGFGSASYLLAMVSLAVYGFCYHKGVIDNRFIKLRKAAREPYFGQMPYAAMGQSGMSPVAMGQSGMSPVAMGQSGMPPAATGQSGMSPVAMSQSGMPSAAMGQSGMSPAAMGQPRMAAGMQKQAKMPGIVWLEGTHKGKTFPLSGEVIIGSAQQSVHIEVMDAFVSKQHCSIRFNPATGYYEIRDLSTNGTYVNNQKLPAGSYVSCASGAVVAMGSTRQMFRLL